MLFYLIINYKLLIIFLIKFYISTIVTNILFAPLKDKEIITKSMTIAVVLNWKKRVEELIVEKMGRTKKVSAEI